MARGIMHSGDPDKVEVMENAPDGRHTVTGIEKWISTDQDGNPIFIQWGNSLVVRLEFKTTNGDPGPAYSATPAELFALANAFGAPLPKVKPENRMTTRTLALIQQSINESGGSLVVESSNGWVNSIPEASPPKGIYNIKFVDAYRPDRKPGDLDWWTGGKQPTLIFEFQIDGDGTGKATIWDGFPVTWWATECFVTETVDSEGNKVPAEVLTFCRTDKGGVPYHARRMEMFIDYFASSLYDHDWQRDALNSEYGVDEVAKPQYVIVDYAKKDAKKVPVFLSIKTPRRGVPRFGFDLLEDMMEVSRDVNDDLEETDLLALANYIEAITPDFEVFTTIDAHNLEFSDKGREWMREYVGGENGPWHRAGLPLENKPALTELTDEQVAAFLKELQAQFGEPSESPNW